MQILLPAAGGSSNNYWTTNLIATTIRHSMQPGLVLIVAGGVALYIASRAAADALRGTLFHSPGRMAAGHWMPIASVAVGAMLLNRSEIAIGVIFGTSVASLTLIIGAITFAAPPKVPITARAIWPTILPAAVLAFLAGFRSELTYLHAITLAIEGFVVCWVWNDPAIAERIPAAPSPRRLNYPALRFLQLILTVGLAGIGAWLAIRGTERTSQLSQVASAGLLSATLLSPLLSLPMLGAGIDLAHRGQSAAAVTSQIAVAILNLCFLLPLVIAIGYLRTFAFDAFSTKWLLSLERLFHANSVATAATPLPLAVWRVDIVGLIAVGLFLLPVAQGRWGLSKNNGIALICGYAAYLLLATALGARL